MNSQNIGSANPFANFAPSASSDSYELSKKLENLSLQNDMNFINNVSNFPHDNGIDNNWNSSTSTTTVKEMSNCAASCSHKTHVGITNGCSNSHDLPRPKRFRPHSNRRQESTIPRKSLDFSSVRKKTQSKTASSYLLRPRATSIGSHQLAQGKFGAACRTLHTFTIRRRKSFSVSSIEIEESDLTSTIPESAEKLSSSNIQQQQQKGCGQEVASPDVPDFDYPVIENGEIDELAEYFEYFVSVNRKMSALAESMYV